MKLKHLSTAIILATLPATGVFAAALDRSGQSISAFLQPNNYFEAGISVLDPDVSGKDTSGNKTGDMAGDYYFPGAALKLQLTDKISFGLLYDQPFGADAGYSGNNNFVTNSVTDTAFSPMQEASVRAQLHTGVINTIANTGVISGIATAANVPTTTVQNWIATDATIPGLGNINALVAAQLPGAITGLNTLYTNNGTHPQLGNVKTFVDGQVQSRINNADTAVRGATGGTQVEVDTNSLSMVFGLSPIKNVTLYAGGVYQTIRGNVSLRGDVYSIYNGYDAQIKETSGAGWLAGAAYQIPDIALKASVTYRSEIDHDASVTESGYSTLNIINPASPSTASSTQKLTITTPQSVNLDLQSGIMADTVAFANVRWVNWKDFSIRPDQFGKVSNLVKPGGFNLVDYSDDQWSVNAGVGRKLSEQWAGNVSVGWDSGAGNPVTTLGPTEGYWNVGLGVQFSPTPATFIAGGVKYFWLGDADAKVSSSNDSVGKFEDNNAIAYGLKMGYRF